jgi:hypothetical protein
MQHWRWKHQSKKIWQILLQMGSTSHCTFGSTFKGSTQAAIMLHLEWYSMCCTYAFGHISMELPIYVQKIMVDEWHVHQRYA